MGTEAGNNGRRRDRDDGQAGGRGLRATGWAALACGALAFAGPTADGEGADPPRSLAVVAALAAISWLRGEPGAAGSRRWEPPVALLGFALGAAVAVAEAAFGGTPWRAAAAGAPWLGGVVAAAAGVWLDGQRRGAARESLIALGLFGLGPLLLVPILLRVVAGLGGQ